MDRREELAQAVTHLERGEQLVESQRALVARLTASGADLDVARDFLEKLETSLGSFRRHLRLIQREVDEDEAADADRTERTRASR